MKYEYQNVPCEIVDKAHAIVSENMGTCVCQTIFSFPVQINEFRVHWNGLANAADLAVSLGKIRKWQKFKDPYNNSIRRFLRYSNCDLRKLFKLLAPYRVRKFQEQP